MTEVVVVHGIWNFQPGLAPAEASARLAERWQLQLAAGYANAGNASGRVPDLAVAYYAYLLADVESQDADERDLDNLSFPERQLAWSILNAAGVPTPQETQNHVLVPVRQAVSWLAKRKGTSAQTLARLIVAFVREVSSYLNRPERRRAARGVVAEAVREHRPTVVVAHSLGSVVAYEALHSATDLPVKSLVTVGSPLGLSGGIFDALEPEPIAGKGAKPAGVEWWVNIADRGDLVAVPRRLGDRFPVDRHEEGAISATHIHSLGGYLASSLTARAIAAILDGQTYIP